MGTITRSHTFSSGEILTADNLNGEINLILSTVNGSIDATNVDATAIPTLTATQTLTNKTLTAPKIGTSILDTGGNELFKLTATSSAVNEITVANAATGNGPTLTSTGGDTNIDLTLSGKGSGKVVVSGDLQISGDDLFMGTNTSGHMLIGDGTNYNPTALTGDVTINGSGVTNISSGVITTSEIAAATLVTEGEGIGSNDNDTTLPTSAAVKDYVDTQVLTEDTISELNDTTIGTLASGHILIWDGSDSWDNKALSGDVTIAANGTTAIGSGVIVNADVSGSAAIADSKLATITTGNKVSGSALQLASTSAIEDSTGVRLKSATAGTGLSMASQVLSVDASQTQITAVGSIATGTWAATDIAVAHGGTGSSTASGARTNLGVAIGSDVQAYDAGLASISGLTTAADKMVYTSGSDTYAVADLSSFARTILDDADAAAVRTTIGAQASGSYQTSDAGLTSIAGLTTAANKMIYTSGSDTYAVADLSAFARTILDDADAAAVRTTIGAQASGSYQTSDAGLTSIAGLTTAADKMIYTSGSDTYAVADLSSFARTILDDANAAAVRATTGAAALGSNSDITSLSGLTTALSVPQGGTGATSLTSSGILLGGGTGAVSASAAMTTNGTLLIGGSGGPEVATLTAGSNVTITNGDGTITIAASGGGGGGASAFTDLSDVGSTTATAGRLMVADGDSWESVAVSGDVALAANGAMTIQANSVALATDTTGNYVATVADAGNSHITVANSGSENAAVTLNIADNAVGIAQLAGIARGKIIVGDSSNNPALLAAGSNGQVLQINGSGDAVWGAAASSGHTIQEEGSGLTARANLNFVGAGVTATDDSGNNATKVTVAASGASLPFTNSNGGSDAIALTSAAIGESLVTDTSPQLGGNLDVNGQSIVSDASNENIPITPHGTGSVVISKADINGGAIDGTAIGAASASTGAFTTLDATGDISGSTVNADGDTSAGDNAAMGYTAAEGLILTGQGSTSDVTIKNDADATVLSIPTGTTNVGIGTTAAIQPLHVATSSGANVLFQLNADSGENTYAARRSRGSAGSPTAIQTDDTILALGAEGYDGSTYAGRAQLKVLAAENWSGSARGTKFAFYGATAGQGGLDSDPWVTIADGNIIMGTSGKGIDFSATSDGAGTDSSELLDDYEEGSFSPVMKYTPSGGSATAYTIASGSYGSYVKIGQFVWFNMQIQISNAAVSNAADTPISVTGLPYASNADNTGSNQFSYSTHMMRAWAFNEANATLAPYVPPNSSTVNGFVYYNNGTAWASLMSDQIYASGGTNYFQISGSYRAA